MTNAQCFYGTAGWSYKDWHGTVYPADKPSGFNPLAFLAQSFDFVEVNTSFYHIPSRKLTEGWVKKTESLDHFKFWVKVYQNFTHNMRLVRNEVEPFKQSMEPLVKASKLEGLLAQFPYSFKLSSQNLDYLLSFPRAFAGYNVAVEFRHDSWNRPEVFDALRKSNLIWVNIDQPVISQSLPLTEVVTHPDTTYVRLHGRNYDNWFADKGRDARYDYDYKAPELEGISETVKKLTELVKQVFVSGNNHYKGNAVKNLKELKKKMEERGISDKG